MPIETPPFKRVLAVDDEVTILRLIRESLGSLLHCVVDTAPIPEHGFELALQKEYDLFLFDYSMPGIDGATLYRLLGKVYQFTKTPPRAAPPLLLVTGHGDREQARQLLREPGVRGLVPKPFQIETLLAQVEDCFGRGGGPGGSWRRRPTKV